MASQHIRTLCWKKVHATLKFWQNRDLDHNRIWSRTSLRKPLKLKKRPDALNQCEVLRLHNMWKSVSERRAIKRKCCWQWTSHPELDSLTILYKYEHKPTHQQFHIINLSNLKMSESTAAKSTGTILPEEKNE